jgi:signal transduction histidine kinase
MEQQMEQMEQQATVGAERRRVEAVVETLANLRGRGESLESVAHDARNMVTALGLYCDLLEEPGVLATQFLHYGSELRLVAAASRRLVEKLVALDSQAAPGIAFAFDGHRSPAGLLAESAAGGAGELPAFARGGLARGETWELFPAEPIDNLAAELKANRNLLAALAGPSIAVTVDVEGGDLPVRLTGEDLTRVLVNLVKNAAEAMPAGGHIALSMHEFHVGETSTPWLVLAVEDNGPGIPRKALEKVFESGYTTRSSSGNGGWASSHRGLGLSITRSIIEAAGGRIHAAIRAQAGACLEIELPVRAR